MKRILSLFAAIALLLPHAAWSQAYPNRPIRIICAFAAGGVVDITARAIAVELTRLLGQPVIVENKPGANGNIGGTEAARSAPDGYTLFLTGASQFAITPLLYAKMPFDPIKDFVPVAPLVAFSNLLVVHPSVPAKSVQELIALAKSRPGKLSFASAGSGTSIHLSGEMFKSMAGIDMIHIPYKGSGAAQINLLGGQVDMMFDSLPTSMVNAKAGKLRPLAVTGAKRSPLFPEVPTIAESGLPGYESTAWLGLVVPVGTPKEIIAKLNAKVIEGANSKEFRERWEPLGYEIITGSPESMAAMLKADIARWAPVVKASGATLE